MQKFDGTVVETGRGCTIEKARSPLLPIFLIVLVDVLGFTIVIPLLTLHAEKFGASPCMPLSVVGSFKAESTAHI